MQYKLLDFMVDEGYRVDDRGNVWSRLKRRCLGGKNGSATYLSDEWKKLKPDRGENGYLRVRLRVKGKHKAFFVHRLVLFAFVGPCPEGMECRHFPNHDPADNRLCNISWGTRKQNGEDRTKQGNLKYGEDHHNAKLTEKDAVEICRLYAGGGWKQWELGEKFGVSQTAVYFILNRKHRWKGWNPPYEASSGKRGGTSQGK